MSELHHLTALEQADGLCAGEFSSADLVEHYLARIERFASLGAFVTVTGEQARERAANPLVEEVALRPSRNQGSTRLAGVPTAIKDLNLTAGVPTRFGSAAMADFVPEISDEVTLRIEAAGLVSLGKTSTPEFGSPCYTEPEGAPPAVTPYDVTRGAGGSSGGAAVAVAAGLVPVAHGSDGGGSIRIPASCCGLVGLKPSRGRVSGAPMHGDPVGLVVSGALARTVRDAAAFLDVLAGKTAGDPFWAPPEAEPFLAACDREPGRLRIARFSTPVIAEVDVDPECLAAWENASRLLESLGHEIVDVPVPIDAETALPAFETCWSVLTALAIVPPEREPLLRPLTRWLTDRGRAVNGPEFGLAIGELRRAAAGALTALAPYDAVLTPTLAAVPAPVGSLRDDADPAADFEAQKRFTPYTSAWNVTGMPAVSLPTHMSAEGLPVGVMLAARPAEEALLLSLAAQMEAAAPWHDVHPPQW
ncbi:amidase [Nocardioides speluncae]|uniref:amidase n=1 Tax=Nocardioides speluncae TaxID=2670337 RepID=UPI000D699EC9|nr:amidase [Nocardioides speluncae]